MTAAAIGRFAQVVAEASASRLEGLELGAETITATPFEPGSSFVRSFPVVAVTLPWSGVAIGESVIVLSPDGARALAHRLAPDAYVEAPELDEAPARGDRPGGRRAATGAPALPSARRSGSI